MEEPMSIGDGVDRNPLVKTMQEDEDESHLPPGVRRQNRCHSSSSEEDEPASKTKGATDTDSSDSESDSGNKKKQSQKSADPPDSPTKGAEAKAADPSKKAGDDPVAKKERDSSRSRSRSGSPSHSHRRRRSSEKSRGSRSRSRSPDRRHRRDRRRRGHRSRSRDRRRSRDRDHHKRRRDHRRSRSKDRKERRRSRDRDRRSSRDRDRRGGRRSRDRSRSRDRNRKKSRSNSPQNSKVIKFGDKVIKPGASFGRPVSSSSSSSSSSKPLTFKEKMRQQFIKAMEEGADVSTALTATDGTVLCTQTAGTQQTQLIPAPTKPPVPLMANIVTSTAGLLATPTITASEAAMQSMLQLQKETTAKTGVEIPSYYNPGAINPVKYAEQVQKRKLLWSKNKEKDVNSQWHATTLAGEHDDKSKEKFRKLMGIKSNSGDGDGTETDQEMEMKQRQIFDQLDKEYQFARMATHTHRGIGLGFGSSGFQPHPPTAVTQPPPPPSTTGT